MWRTAERRFVQHDGHVCQRNPFSPFLFGIPSIHSPWEPQHAPPALDFCIIPKFVVAEENLSHAEKKRIWAQSCGLQKVLQCTDCAPLWLLQTKLLASAGWKRGCEHFSYRCSHHVTTCLFQDPFPPFRFGIPSIHSQTEDWGPWEGQCAPPILHYACIVPIPSLQLQKKAPVSCREAKSLVTELCSPRFVTYNTVIVSKVWVRGYWLCSQLWHVTSDCCKPMTILASVGWKWGWQPFSCPCSLNAMHCRKEICLTCLSKESMPFVKSKCPLPTPNQKLEVPERDSALQQFCIMLASCPSLRCSCRKKIRLMQRSKGFCSGVVVSKTCLDLLQCSDCALSCAIWLLRTHEHLSRLSV